MMGRVVQKVNFSDKIYGPQRLFVNRNHIKVRHLHACDFHCSVVTIEVLHILINVFSQLAVKLFSQKFIPPYQIFLSCDDQTEVRLESTVNTHHKLINLIKYDKYVYVRMYCRL